RGEYFWDYNIFGKEFREKLERKVIVCTKIVKTVVTAGFITVGLFCLTTVFDETKVVLLICWTQEIKQVLFTVLKFHGKINIIFSLYFIVLYLVTAALASIRSYILMIKQVLSSPSFADSIKSMYYLSSMLLQVDLLFITTSNIEIEVGIKTNQHVYIIFSQAQNLSDEIYNVNWEITSDTKIRKHILFMLMKSQIPLSITGGGILHVNRNEYVGK
ncbi:7tm 6 domain containing protein, partial [Asbolus verrucosus]